MYICIFQEKANESPPLNQGHICRRMNEFPPFSQGQKYIHVVENVCGCYTCDKILPSLAERHWLGIQRGLHPSSC